MTLKNLLWRVSLLLLLTGVLKAQTPALDALNEGRYDEALRLYRLQATESPESVEALLGLSKALSGLERYEEALRLSARMVGAVCFLKIHPLPSNELSVALRRSALDLWFRVSSPPSCRPYN